MKKFSLPLILAFSAFSLHAQDSSALKTDIATWQSQPVIIDGLDADWSTVLPFSDDKAKIKYAITSNDTAIFIFVKTSDEFAKAKMLQAGFKVSFNTEGKKKQSSSISFPMKPEEDFQFQPGQMQNLKGLEALALMNATRFETDGFAAGNAVYFANDQAASPIKVMMGINAADELVYEASVPLQSLYKKAKSGDNTNLPLAVCFTINAINRPAAPGSTGAGSVPPGATRSGGAAFISSAPPKQDMLGGKNQPDLRKFDDLFEGNKVWKMVSLAKH